MILENFFYSMTIMTILILGFVTKKTKWIPTSWIPLQNILLSFFIMLLYYFITLEWNWMILFTVFAIMGFYDIVHIFQKILSIKKNLNIK